MNEDLKTFDDLNSAGSVDGWSNYAGDRSIKDHFVAPVSCSRDSGPLADSNFEVALEALGGEEGPVEVHRFNHWGCGWFELILVDPTWEPEPEYEGMPLEEVLETLRDLRRSSEDYPVLDDEDYSRREHEATGDRWDWMSMRERVDLLRAEKESVFAARSHWDELYDRAPETYYAVREKGY